MKRTVAIALLMFVLCTPALRAHDFYISITTIQHQPSEDKLKVQIRIFVNDLEEAIYQDQGVRVGLWKNRPIANASYYIQEYVCSNFALSVNQIPVPVEFLSFSVESADILEDHVIICELHATKIPGVKSLNIYNSLLTEIIDSQVNIVNILSENSRIAINLDKRVLEDEVNLE